VLPSTEPVGSLLPDLLAMLGDEAQSPPRARQLVVLAVEPPEHVRARLRRLGDRLETVAVLAAVPLAIGVLGTYGQLLDTF
jgi:hypothetical protein